MSEPEVMQDQNEFVKRLNSLFYWTLFAFVIFIVSWTASTFRHLLGFDPHFAGNNFAFNILFLFPATIVCLLIMFFTGGLTIRYWKTIPNLTKKIITVILSYGVLIFVVYTFLMVLRQH
jgi:hypothetical protein